jgi:hypothetical protein
LQKWPQARRFTRNKLSSSTAKFTRESKACEWGLTIHAGWPFRKLYSAVCAA